MRWKHSRCMFLAPQKEGYFYSKWWSTFWKTIKCIIHSHPLILRAMAGIFEGQGCISTLASSMTTNSRGVSLSLIMSKEIKANPMKKSHHRKGKETNADRVNGILSGWHQWNCTHCLLLCFCAGCTPLLSHWSFVVLNGQVNVITYSFPWLHTPGKKLNSIIKLRI